MAKGKGTLIRDALGLLRGSTKEGTNLGKENLSQSWDSDLIGGVIVETHWMLAKVSGLF